MKLEDLIEEWSNGEDPVHQWAARAYAALCTARVALSDGDGEAFEAVDEVLRATEEEV